MRVFSRKSGRRLEPPATQWGWPNVRWGIGEGWWFAKRLLVLGIVLMALGGPSILRRNHVTALGLVALYGVGIPSIGAIAGALRPLCRTSLGTAFVGTVAVLPVSFCLAFLVLPLSWGVGFRTWYPLGFSILYGTLGGIYLRSVYNR